MSVSQNNKSLKIAILIIGFILALIGAFIAGGYAGYDQRVEQQKAEASKATKPLDAYTIYNLVNAERVKAGVKPLLLDPNLAATAQARADDMVARNYFGHNDPVSGENLVNILKSQKQCIASSENIGMTNGYDDDNQKQLEWWVKSPAHYAAIKNSLYTSTGIAVNGNKVVQHFCQTK